MASLRKANKKRDIHARIEVGLVAPGMTPLLRAGVGGLAASLRAILRATDPGADWPSPVGLGPGRATVEPKRVVIDLGAEPAATLRVLFEAAFAIKPPGVIDLAGARRTDAEPDLVLSVALQNGLKRTFLQHGKSTTKSGGPTVQSVEIGGGPVSVSVQGYSGYAHRDEGPPMLLDALEHGVVELAGWAYPGAVERHVGFGGVTRCEYDPGLALAGFFALVGCLSFEVPRSRGAGVLLIVEPTDLVRYAETRPRLTPLRAVDAVATGPGDAALAVQLALRSDANLRDRPGVGAFHAVVLRAQPWAKQQKSRSGLLAVKRTSPQTLDAYEDLIAQLPTRIKVRTREKDEEQEEEEIGFFFATSALRAFVADNLASGSPWHAGFAQATTGGKKPLFIHYYRAKDGTGLGALYPEERKGLIAMVKHLEDVEAVLVRSVHAALRQRFGAIAEESRAVPATMKNRFEGEREKWRIAFAGSKTPDQIRGALADLWSRAGSSKELRENWEMVLPMLRPAHWQTTRDLALVALASYAGSGPAGDHAEETREEEEDS